MTNAFHYDIIPLNLERLVLVYQYSSEDNNKRIDISLSIFIKSSKIRHYAVGYGGIPPKSACLNIQVSCKRHLFCFLLHFGILLYYSILFHKNQQHTSLIFPKSQKRSTRNGEGMGKSGKRILKRYK